MLAGCWTLDVGLQYPAAPPSAYKLYPGAENFGLVAVWCAKALNLKSRTAFTHAFDLRLKDLKLFWGLE